MLDKRKPSVISIKNSVNYENNGNKQQQYKFIGSILKNSVNSKMNNSITIGNNIHQNIGSVISFKVKNNILLNELKSTDENINQLNSTSINLL